MSEFSAFNIACEEQVNLKTFIELVFGNVYQRHKELTENGSVLVEDFVVPVDYSNNP